MLHYVENAAEFRADAERRGLRGPVVRAVAAA